MLARNTKQFILEQEFKKMEQEDKRKSWLVS